MPILIDYNPGGGADLLELAHQTGQTQGAAQRRQQQVAIDAGVQRQAIAAAQERNSQPGFYERVSQGAAAEGRYAQERQDALEAQDAARTEREQAARMTRRQADEAQTEVRTQREQAARMIEDFNAGGQTPEAAQQYVAQATRRGIKPDERIAAAAGPLTPGENTARTNAARGSSAAASSASIAERRAAEQERANREREAIERERIRAGGARRPAGPSAANQRADDQAELLGYGYSPSETVALFEPDVNGRPSPQAAAALRGVLAPNKTPGQIAQRIAELEGAGASPAVVQMMRAKLTQREAQAEQARQRFEEVGQQAHQAVMSLPPNAGPADIDAVLQQSGMSIDEYEAYLNNQAEQLGLTR